MNTIAMNTDEIFRKLFGDEIFRKLFGQAVARGLARGLKPRVRRTRDPETEAAAEAKRTRRRARVHGSSS